MTGVDSRLREVLADPGSSKIKDTKFLSLIVSSNNFDLKLIDAAKLRKYVNSLIIG